MTMDAVPELTALIEAVRGTLTGNAATLQTALQGSRRRQHAASGR